MELIKFPEHNVVIAENQPQYLPMPAYIDKNSADGHTIICWKFSWKERFQLLFTGKLWHRILTFHGPMQPMMLQTTTPFKALEPANP